MAEQTVTDDLETGDIDYNKALTKRGLRSALSRSLVLITVNGSSRTRKLSLNAFMQVTAVSRSLHRFICYSNRQESRGNDI